VVQVYQKLSIFKKIKCAFILGTLFFLSSSMAQQSEVERLRGFKRFKNQNKMFDAEREEGYTEYLEDLEKDLLRQHRALAEFKKKRRLEVPLEETKYYQQYLNSKKEEQDEYDESLEGYLKEQKKWGSEKFKRPFSEEFELDIVSDRPRYEIKKRALYGGKPKYEKKSAASGAPGMSSGAKSSNSGGSGKSEGSVPPPLPPPGEPFYEDIPPPPPPPPMPMEGMEDFGNDGFIPPPPPPPPMFDGEF
jgi:hypothetical protein